MSTHTSQAAVRQNHLLAAVPPRELDPLRACFVRVQLARGQVLADHDQPVDHALFMEHGAVSIVADCDGGGGVQVAMIGREGVVGGLSRLGLRHHAFGKAVVQIPGAALRVAVPDLRRALDRSPALDEACTRFAHALVDQVVQTAACNARRSLVERCARWLVIAHDRVEGDDVRVTHETLSAMLGVRRAGVTVAAAALQQAGLIRASRGRLAVLDRAGLQDVARGAGLPAVPPAAVPPAAAPSAARPRPARPDPTRPDVPRGGLRLPEHSAAF